MDFASRQEDARRATVRLIALFALSVAVVIVLVHLLAAYCFWFVGVLRGDPPPWYGGPALFVWVSVGTLLVIGIATYWQWRELRAGGAFIAEKLGGEEVLDSTFVPRRRRLSNVVAEAAVAAGAPSPAVFVLPNEPCVNAFAIGTGPEDGAIGVTQGALDAFTRPELAAVVSHEMGHLLNGDSRMNMHVLGASAGLESVFVLGYWMIHSAVAMPFSFPIIFVGVFLAGIGLLGRAAASILRAGVSREREFLADAHAAELTRDPKSLATALVKVMADGRRGKLRTARGTLVSHLLLHGPARRFRPAWMNTHPTLASRIEALDPTLELPPSRHWSRNFSALKRRLRRRENA